MNQQLLSQVMASCVNAPDWLMKKRQLAVLLQERFKSTPATEKIIAAWLENPSLAQLEQSVGEQANAHTRLAGLICPCLPLQTSIPNCCRKI